MGVHVGYMEMALGRSWGRGEGDRGQVTQLLGLLTQGNQTVLMYLSDKRDFYLAM